MAHFRFMVLDFSLVTGIDFSGIERLLLIKRKILNFDIRLIFCSVHAMEEMLKEAGMFSDESPNETCSESDDEAVQSYSEMIQIFDTLNLGLEWSENMQLQTLSESEHSSQGKFYLVHLYKALRYSPVVRESSGLRRAMSNRTARAKKAARTTLQGK